VYDVSIDSTDGRDSTNFAYKPQQVVVDLNGSIFGGKPK